MANLIRRKHWHPNHAQELLLKAALLDGQPMIKAYNAWIKNTTIDQIDYASYRLLPLLYHNLKNLNFNHPLLSDLKKVYVETWAKNQILFRKISPLLKAFQKADIDTLVLKGASLTINYYRDFGLRPMSDFDLLIHPHQFDKAFKLLSHLGWSPELNSPEKSLPTFLSMHHALNFINPDNYSLDLHWHTLKMCLGLDADIAFWQDAMPITIQGVETLCLNPTDNLLHTCVHGAEWNPMPPIRWVADAVTILKSNVEIDWHRLLSLVEKHGLSLQLIDTIDYLMFHFKAPIPTDFIDNLRGVPVSKQEQREYRLLNNHPLLSFYMPTIAHYPRIAHDTGRPPGFFGYLKYWQTIMALDHIWQAPLSFIWQIIKRVLKIKTY